LASVGSNMIPAWKKQVLLGVLRRHEMRVTDLCPVARTGTRSCDLPAPVGVQSYASEWRLRNSMRSVFLTDSALLSSQFQIRRAV